MWSRMASLGGSELRLGPLDAGGVRTQEESWPGIPGLHPPTGSCMALDELLNLSGP